MKTGDLGKEDSSLSREPNLFILLPGALFRDGRGQKRTPFLGGAKEGLFCACMTVPHTHTLFPPFSIYSRFSSPSSSFSTLSRFSLSVLAGGGDMASGLAAASAASAAAGAASEAASMLASDYQFGAGVYS